jgi:hypothetical protein
MPSIPASAPSSIDNHDKIQCIYNKIQWADHHPKVPCGTPSDVRFPQRSRPLFRAVAAMSRIWPASQPWFGAHGLLKDGAL